MNILVLTADYPPIEGGISTVTREAARELGELGHSVTIVAPYFDGMYDFDRSEPATVVRFRGYKLGWLRVVPMLFAARDRMPWADVVLAMNVSHGGLIAWLLKGFSKKPYAIVAYAYEFLRFRNAAVLSGLLRDIFNDAIAVIAISRYTQQALADFGVEGERIHIVFPGAPETFPFDESVLRSLRRKYVLPEKNVILAVGRFIKRKNHVRLVQALPAILERHPDAVIVMAGQGPEMPAVAREAMRLGVRGHVRFPGRLNDPEIAKFYALCDVFALPTGAGKGGHVEGFGLVFAEAHAYGKPVVAGRSGGTEDAVHHEETGLLVDPENAEELAGAIIAILDDPELATRYGEEGRARVVRELNWRAFAEKISEALHAS